MKLKTFAFLFSGLILPVLNGQTPADAIKNYVSFLQADSTGDLAKYKSCFAPEERDSIRSLPEFNEAAAFSNGKITVLEDTRFGLLHEIRFREEASGLCDSVVLKQQDGKWYISNTFTGKLKADLTDDCAEKLTGLYENLENYAQKHNSIFPQGNDAAGWQELLNSLEIKDSSATRCPQSNAQYKYIGKRSLDSDPLAPLAYCPHHYHSGSTFNVLRVNGKVLAGNANSNKVVQIDRKQMFANTAPRLAPLAFAPARTTAGNNGGNSPFIDNLIVRPTAAVPAQTAAPAIQAPVPTPEPPPLVLKAPKHWLKGPTPDWYIHFDDAVAAAKRSGKLIYALCTGSDWCPPCMRLEKNILSTREFQDFAKKHLILLFVDLPRRKPTPPDQKAYNRQLSNEINFGNYVPSIMLLSSEGGELEKITNRLDTASHIAHITDLLKKHDKNFGSRASATVSTPAAQGSGAQPAAPASGWITVEKPAAPQAPAAAASKAPDPPMDWLKGPHGWFITWEKAAEEAKKRNKKILALSTGSDWCPWCIKLKKDVLDSIDFKAFAENNLVLLYIDKPSARASMPEAQKSYNAQLRKKIKLQGFPVTVLYTADGKRLGDVRGYLPLGKYMDEVKKLVGK